MHCGEEFARQRLLAFVVSEKARMSQCMSSTPSQEIEIGHTDDPLASFQLSCMNDINHLDRIRKDMVNWMQCQGLGLRFWGEIGVGTSISIFDKYLTRNPTKSSRCHLCKIAMVSMVLASKIKDSRVNTLRSFQDYWGPGEYVDLEREVLRTIDYDIDPYDIPYSQLQLLMTVCPAIKECCADKKAAISTTAITNARIFQKSIRSLQFTSIEIGLAALYIAGSACGVCCVWDSISELRKFIDSIKCAVEKCILDMSKALGAAAKGHRRSFSDLERQECSEQNARKRLKENPSPQAIAHFDVLEEAMYKRHV